MPRLAALVALIVISGAVGFLVLGEESSATSYNPAASASLADNAPGATSDIMGTFDIPSPNANFRDVITFTPPGFKVVDCTAATASPACADAVIPDGTSAASLSSDATLGTLNGACSQTVNGITFDLKDATTNMSTTTVYQDTDEDGTGEQFEDDDNDGNANGVEMYPDYLTRLVRTAPYPGGSPAEPIQRLYGQTVVATSDVGLNFLVFAPGVTINGITLDPALGYPSISVLNNTGDPAGVFKPTAITDFCTPLAVRTTTFGMAGGHAHRTNPSGDSTVTFTVWTQSLPDADDDGIDNGLDPCATQGNPDGWDPRAALPSGDNDGDGLPAACDPNDGLGGFNDDEDGDGWKNRADNCPNTANADAADVDRDGIGNACDSNNAAITGHTHIVCLFDDVNVGAGGTPGNVTQVPPCGNTPSTGTPTEAPTPTGGVTATPTGGATETPEPTGPTPTGGATETPTGGPTETPTVTPVPTVTPTADPNELEQGDFNCDGETTAQDALAILAEEAGADADIGGSGCQPIGAQFGDNTFGDVDCDGDADAMDALIVLLEASGIDVPHSGECPDFGQPVTT